MRWRIERDKPVAHAGDRLYKSRIFRSVVDLALDQEDKQLHGLRFEGDAAANARELEAAAVEPKATEFVDGSGHETPFAAEV